MSTPPPLTRLHIAVRLSLLCMAVCLVAIACFTAEPICGDIIHFDIGGEWHGFDINDPHRPACFMEPSSTPDGWEIIHYSRMSGRGAPEYHGDPLGFEVRCPNKKGH